jgi:hypothetical protein
MLFSCWDSLQPLFFGFSANESGEAERLFPVERKLGKGGSLSQSLCHMGNQLPDYQRIAPDVKLGRNVRIHGFVNLYGC